MISNLTLATTVASSSLITDDDHSSALYEDSAGDTFTYYVNDKLYLRLRYYARHVIPILCVVGILGNCMALMLIRFVSLFNL